MKKKKRKLHEGNRGKIIKRNRNLLSGRVIRLSLSIPRRSVDSPSIVCAHHIQFPMAKVFRWRHKSYPRGGTDLNGRKFLVIGWNGSGMNTVLNKDFDGVFSLHSLIQFNSWQTPPFPIVLSAPSFPKTLTPCSSSSAPGQQRINDMCMQHT